MMQGIKGMLKFVSIAVSNLVIWSQVGPKDVESNTCVMARRDRPGEMTEHADGWAERERGHVRDREDK